jgi:uncharacterized protein (DUF433 family)
MLHMDAWNTRMNSGTTAVHRFNPGGDLCASVAPHGDPSSPVRINPLVRFGRPAVSGISTEAIAGELEAGASAEEVAADFGLDLDAVRWAHSYELAHHAAA